MNEVTEVVEKLDSAFANFKENHLDAINTIEERLDNIDKKENRRGLGGLLVAKSPDMGNFFVNAHGRQIPVLAKEDKLINHYPREIGEDQFSLANYVRAAMGLEVRAAVTSGPATVPTGVGAEIIDAVRAASVVIEAGSGTINIDGPTNIARIATDPTVYSHTEGVEDIAESDIVLEPVSLDPLALVAAIPLSMEIVADSPNLDAALTTSLGAAYAGKLDALCLALMLADTNIPTSATGQDPAAWANVLEAVGAAMALNQGLPKSMISNTADFIARASQLASTAGSWLGKPPVLSNMAELPTTGVTAGTGIFGDFSKSFAIAVRQGLRLEVVRFGKHKSATHILVAHARMGGVVLQPEQLFIQQATVA